jgi:hypothetical protein
MGLKCSLFGHSYDEREMVRERESKGSEVVTVVKDVERCTECDATRVVSTNKEVVSTAGATADGGVSTDTTLRTPGDEPAAGDDDAFESPDQLGTDAPSGTGEPTTASETSTGAATESGDTGGFGSIVDRSGSAGDADDGGVEAATGGAAETVAPDTGEDEGVELMTDDASDPADPADVDLDAEPADATDVTADEADPVTEDAEILTDEPASDRAPGQWPGDEAGEAWEPEPLTHDEAEEVDAPDEPETDASDADKPESAEILDDDRDAGGTPNTAAEPAPDIEPEPAATASFTVPEGHYRCPECGHTIPAESSFRRGDACPECVHGYLEASE